MRQCLREFDVFYLRAFIAACQQDDDLAVAFGVVHTPAAAKMQSQFADSFAYRGNITRVSILQPVYLHQCHELEITEQMKQMDFFARLGADPQPYGLYGKELQRRLAEKDAVSCFVISSS